jgi:hypothetical protein
MACAIKCLNINKDFMSKKNVVKLDNKELPKLKLILALREGELKDLSVTNFRFGKLGNELGISFNVYDEELYDKYFLSKSFVSVLRKAQSQKAER